MEPVDDALITAALTAVGEQFLMGILVFDRSLDVVWASAATPVVLGWDQASLLGVNALELIDPSDIERVMPIIEPVLGAPVPRVLPPAAAHALELSLKAIAQDGSPRPVLVAGRVLGDTGHLVVTVRPGGNDLRSTGSFICSARGSSWVTRWRPCLTSCASTSTRTRP
ncbi:MAG TPA: PAS domain-containing protein [Microthrixaceae bacterium]|nr:PAS domain-containing protein [Microthrixaceae bacterium]